MCQEFSVYDLPHGKMTNIHDWTTSVAKYIEHSIETGEAKRVEKIHLIINIDGVQIFK